MCTGKTHDRMSAAAYLAVTGSTTLTHATAVLPAVAFPGPAAWAALAVGTAMCGGSGVTPDIDCANSTVAESLGFITRLFALFLTKVCGVKHRHGTHSLLGVTVFTMVAWALTAGRAGGGVPLIEWVDRAQLVIILTVIFSSGLCVIRVPVIRRDGLWVQRVTGHTGDLAALVAAAAMTITGWGLALLPAAVAVGCATHIAGDMLTDQGCPLLWPLTDRHFFLTWPPFLRFTTGHWVERVPLAVVIATVTAWLVVSRVGPYLPVHLPHILEAAR